ncbi:endonuclease/exonuclease/phosphatase family protein [Roseibium sp. MMSF_3544]|uniref:endonuclease/exonuclease/phosphatase family protein n=1 Tax=unclassified Roseibium TaxID=2629323 RepID=UPI00273F4A30|nr:endonuclease/exonuclease/phosphatase family protein [Roseibium sp. MMSF_3544]
MSDRNNGETRSFLKWALSLICWCGSLGALTFCALGLSTFVAPDYWFTDNMSFFLRQLLAGGFVGCLAGLVGLLMRHRFAILYRLTWALAVIALVSLTALTGARTLENVADTEALQTGELPVKIISINIKHLFLGDETLATFLEQEKPDILVIQEALWWLQERRWERLGLPVGGAGANGFPSNLKVGAMGSLVVYSRFPILQDKSHVVEGDLHRGSKLIHDPDRELLQLKLETDAGPFDLMSVHPDSPRNHVRWLNKRLYFDTADAIMHELRETGSDPLIVIGDWNSSPWSARFQRTLAQNNLRTAYPGGWPQTTRFFFDYRLHWILGAPVDQFAVSGNVRVLSVSTGPDIGSDHLPLIVDLALPRSNAN